MPPFMVPQDTEPTQVPPPPTLGSAALPFFSLLWEKSPQISASALDACLTPLPLSEARATLLIFALCLQFSNPLVL